MIVPRRIYAVVGLALLALLAAAVVGTYAYRLGLAEGLADAGRLAAPGAAAVPYVYPGPFWYHGPFGFGGFLIPLLFFFVLFAVFRRAAWGWGRGYGYGACGSGVPPRFEEWHRRAHESTTAGETKA
jgi:hypothetical protein